MNLLQSNDENSSETFILLAAVAVTTITSAVVVLCCFTYGSECYTKLFCKARRERLRRQRVQGRVTAALQRARQNDIYLVPFDEEENQATTVEAVALEDEENLAEIDLNPGEP